MAVEAPEAEGLLATPGAVAVLTVTCGALGLATLSATAVNVALPDIAADVGARLAGLQWVANAYTLVYAAVLLPAGGLGDRLGRRRLFLAGTAVYAAGSLGCTLAPGLWTLVGFRVLQAVGSSAMVPATLAVLAGAFPAPRARAQALGLWAGVASLGLALGPLVGGALIAAWGWRGVFGLVALLGAATYLAGHRLLAADRHGAVLAAERVDVAGSLLGVGWLGGLSFALIEASRYGWTSALIVAALAGSTACLVGFVTVESALDRRGGHPLMPPRIWRSPTFVLANVGGATYFLSLFGILFFFSLYLQQERGDSPLVTGLLFLPLTAAMALLAPYAGRMVAAAGVRPVVSAGLAVAAAGCLTLATLPADAGSGALAWRFLLTGLGFGLSSAPLTTAAVAGVAEGSGSVASAVYNASRQVGAVFGVAVLGAVVSARVGQRTGGAAFLTGVHAAMVVSAGCLLACAVGAALLLQPRER